MKRDGSQAGKEEKRPCGGREQRGQKAGDRCGKRKKKRAQVVDGERWSSQKRGEIKERNCRRREVGKKMISHLQESSRADISTTRRLSPNKK